MTTRWGETGAGLQRSPWGTLDSFRTTVGAAGLGFARRAVLEAITTRARAAHVRPHAGRLPAHAEEDRRDGGGHRRLGATGLSRRLDQDVQRVRVTRETSMAKLHAPGRRSASSTAQCSCSAAWAWCRAWWWSGCTRGSRAAHDEGASEVLELIIGARTLGGGAGSSVREREAPPTRSRGRPPPRRAAFGRSGPLAGRRLPAGGGARRAGLRGAGGDVHRLHQRAQAVLGAGAGRCRTAAAVRGLRVLVLLRLVPPQPRRREGRLLRERLPERAVHALDAVGSALVAAFARCWPGAPAPAWGDARPARPP